MSSELDALVGKRVALDLRDGAWTAPVVEGKFVAYSSNGLALETRDGPIVFNLADLDDIREVRPPGKISRRLLRAIPTSQARQHLADRHATPWSVVRAMPVALAKTIHDRMDHADLGHRHRAAEMEDE